MRFSTLKRFSSPRPSWLSFGPFPLHPCLSHTGNTLFLPYWGCVVGNDSLSWPAGNSLPNAAQDTIGLFVTRARCLLMSKGVSPPSAPCPLLQSCFSAGCQGLFLPRCRTLHFLLLNFVRFLSAHCSWCIVIKMQTDTESGVLPLNKVCLDLPALCLLQKLFLKVTVIFFYSLFLIMLNLTFFPFLLFITLLVHKISEHDIPWFPFLLA